jgi:hypothetical protein
MTLRSHSLLEFQYFRTFRAGHAESQRAVTRADKAAIFAYLQQDPDLRTHALSSLREIHFDERTRLCVERELQEPVAPFDVTGLAQKPFPPETLVLRFGLRRRGCNRQRQGEEG